MLAFCMPEETASHEQYQGLLSVKAVARSPWTMALVTSEMLDDKVQ